MYYWDSTSTLRRTKETSFVGSVETVAGNKAAFSARDIKHAKMARNLQHIAGHMTYKLLMKIAKENLLQNSPITPRDVKLIKEVFGSSVPGIKGKSIRRRNNEVEGEMVRLPTSILKYYQNIVLSVNVMNLNKIPFLTTISKHFHYGTVTPLENMQIPTMLNVILELMKFYQKRNFKITMILADGQFKGLKIELAP